MVLWNQWQEDWLLYHKVVFDGINKTIYVTPGVTTLSVKTDLYSDWKEWVLLRDNAKFLPAIRSIGGDPVGGGLYAGDMYFLMNGWQLVIDHYVAISGILYHDDPISPYVILPGGGVTSSVSTLAYAYNTTGAAAGPTAAQIATEVWDTVASVHITPGTTGAKLSNIAIDTTNITANVANLQITADTILAVTI